MKLRESTLCGIIGLLGLVAPTFMTGCNVSIRKFGETRTVKEGNYPPFIKAAQMGDIAEADRLMRSGEPVRQTTIGNLTALHLAAIEGQDQMVEWLISHEADLFARDLNGKTPAAFAREGGKANSEKLITESLQQYQKELSALQKNDFTLAKELMAKDPRHCSLLHILAQLSITEEAIKEIQAGADVNARTAMEMTPLHLTTYSGDVEIAKALVKAGADVNAVDAYNETPLYMAARESKKELLIFLLASGGDKSIRSRVGNETPLDAAVRLVHLDIVKLLEK